MYNIVAKLSWYQDMYDAMRALSFSTVEIVDRVIEVKSDLSIFFNCNIFPILIRFGKKYLCSKNNIFVFTVRFTINT